MTDWRPPDDLTELEHTGAEGVEPGAGGVSGGTAGDLHADDTGGAVSSDVTSGGSLGAPPVPGPQVAPGAPDGSPDALTPDQDLVGGDPEELIAEGRRQLPQPTNRAGEQG